MIAGILGAWIAPVVASGAGATTSTTLPGPAPNQSQINSTESQVSQIEATLAQEEQQTSILDEKYDTAEQNAEDTQNALASLNATMVRTKSAVDVDKRLVANDAVEAYIYGTPESGYAAYFNSSASDQQARTQYTNQIVGDLQKDENGLQRSESKLQTEEVQQQQVAAQEQAEAAQTKTLAAANEQEAATTQATLHQIQGQLAQEVAQAAIEEAQEEAAAAAAAASAAARSRPPPPQQPPRPPWPVPWAGRRTARRPPTRPIRPPVPRPTKDRSPAPPRATRSRWPPSRPPSPSWARPMSSAGRRRASGSTARDWCSGRGGRPASPSRGRPRRSGRRSRTCHSTTLEPGDLLFYYNLDGDDQVDHVVMYTGSGPYGTDTVIQAPYTGSTVSYSPIFTEGLIGAARP